MTSVGEDVEKQEPVGTASVNVKWCSHCGKVRQFLEKLDKLYS